MASLKTPVSGTSPFCTGANFIDRYDVRLCAELLSDTGEPLDVADVATNTRLNTLLMSQSGRFEAACNKGGIYSPDDLAILNGNCAAWVATVIADLTSPHVLGRRFISFPEFVEWNKEAEAVLKALADGEAILSLQENIDASVLDDHVETNQEVEDREMITFQARQYFGRRANRSTKR